MVDDDASIRAGAATTTTDFGIQRIGLWKRRRVPGERDFRLANACLLLDVYMPGMTGIELCRKMTESGRQRADDPDQRPRRSADQENDARGEADRQLAQAVRRKKPATGNQEGFAQSVEFAPLSAVNPCRRRNQAVSLNSRDPEVRQRLFGVAALALCANTYCKVLPTKGSRSAAASRNSGSGSQRLQSQARDFHFSSDATTSDQCQISSRSATGVRASAANGRRLRASNRWSVNCRRRWRECRLTKSTAKSNSGWARSAGRWISTGAPSTSAIRRTNRYAQRIPGFEPNFPPFPQNYDPEKLIQRSTELVMSGKTLVFARPSDIPIENQDTRRFVEKYGPKASAAIPMWAGGRVIGAVSFGKFRSTREMAAGIARSAGTRGAAVWQRDRAQAIRDGNSGSSHRTQGRFAPQRHERTRRLTVA